MKKKFSSLVLATLLFACSSPNLSKNTISKGDFFINGGQSADKVWQESLKFERLSWYKELTMFFDLRMARLDEASPFLHWFSDSEKVEIKNCEQFYIVLSYALDSSFISTKNFLDQMSEAHFKKVLINNFFRSLKLHPDYESSSLKSYDVYGLCRAYTNEKKDISITFPSFPTTIL